MKRNEGKKSEEIRNNYVKSVINYNTPKNEAKSNQRATENIDSISEIRIAPSNSPSLSELAFAMEEGDVKYFVPKGDNER
jgi:hypothetical protein